MNAELCQELAAKEHEIECSTCHGIGYGHTPSFDCRDCGGTGRVSKPLLEGVREPCPGYHGATDDWAAKYYCELCQGRGWVVSIDLRTWIDAAKGFKRQVEMINYDWALIVYALVRSDDAFLEALSRATDAVLAAKEADHA